MENEKIYKCVFVVMLVLFTVAFTGFAVQTWRISRLESELGQYRDAAQQITECQQSIDVGLQSAQECISSATGSVHELREGLRTLEKIFADLENDNNNLRSYISSIDTNYSNEGKLK